MCPWIGSPCVVYEVRDRGKTRSRAEKGKAGGDAYVIIVFSLASSVESSLLETRGFQRFVIALFGRTNRILIFETMDSIYRNTICFFPYVGGGPFSFVVVTSIKEDDVSRCYSPD